MNSSTVGTGKPKYLVRKERREQGKESNKDEECKKDMKRYVHLSPWNKRIKGKEDEKELPTGTKEDLKKL